MFVIVRSRGGAYYGERRGDFTDFQRRLLCCVGFVYWGVLAVRGPSCTPEFNLYNINFCRRGA